MNKEKIERLPRSLRMHWLSDEERQRVRLENFKGHLKFIFAFIFLTIFIHFANEWIYKLPHLINLSFSGWQGAVLSIPVNFLAIIFVIVHNLLEIVCLLYLLLLAFCFKDIIKSMYGAPPTFVFNRDKEVYKTQNDGSISLCFKLLQATYGDSENIIRQKVEDEEKIAFNEQDDVGRKLWLDVSEEIDNYYGYTNH